MVAVRNQHITIDDNHSYSLRGDWREVDSVPIVLSEGFGEVVTVSLEDVRDSNHRLRIICETVDDAFVRLSVREESYPPVQITSVNYRSSDDAIAGLENNWGHLFRREIQAAPRLNQVVPLGAVRVDTGEAQDQAETQLEERPQRVGCLTAMAGGINRLDDCCGPLGRVLVLAGGLLVLGASFGVFLMNNMVSYASVNDGVFSLDQESLDKFMEKEPSTEDVAVDITCTFFMVLGITAIGLACCLYCRPEEADN